MKDFLELYAIKVRQSLCDFYLTSIKAGKLQTIAFSEQLQYTDEEGKLHGSQRKIDDKRLKEIGKYIESVEMSFPNTIILAVNYSEDGEMVDDERIRWDIEEINEDVYKIKVPTDAKLAAIIDGQHRLKGFDEPYLSDPDKLDIELPCSIFFDLPNSYQAFLFATINGNQKKVDKSLALEQFGFNVEDEPQHSWTPEKLAVFFTRRLNFKNSPVSGHIKIAPKITNELVAQIFDKPKEWTVSTATIVEGILNLISSQPKRDRVEMAMENIWGKRTRSMVAKFTRDRTPLRHLYLEKEDEKIFDIIVEFLAAVRDTVWKQFDTKSYIFKTVGVQALFDLLKRILEKEIISTRQEFEIFLSESTKYDFSNPAIQASGIGRKDIRNALLLAAGITSEADLKPDDIKKINSLKN